MKNTLYWLSLSFALLIGWDVSAQTNSLKLTKGAPTSDQEYYDAILVAKHGNDYYAVLDWNKKGSTRKICKYDASMKLVKSVAFDTPSEASGYTGYYAGYYLPRIRGGQVIEGGKTVVVYYNEFVQKGRKNKLYQIRFDAATLKASPGVEVMSMDGFNAALQGDFWTLFTPKKDKVVMVGVPGSGPKEDVLLQMITVDDNGKTTTKPTTVNLNNYAYEYYPAALQMARYLDSKGNVWIAGNRKDGRGLELNRIDPATGKASVIKLAGNTEVYSSIKITGNDTHVFIAGVSCKAANIHETYGFYIASVALDGSAASAYNNLRHNEKLSASLNDGPLKNGALEGIFISDIAVTKEGVLYMALDQINNLEVLKSMVMVQLTPDFKDFKALMIPCKEKVGNAGQQGKILLSNGRSFMIVQSSEHNTTTNDPKKIAGIAGATDDPLVAEFIFGSNTVKKSLLLSTADEAFLAFERIWQEDGRMVILLKTTKSNKDFMTPLLLE